MTGGGTVCLGHLPWLGSVLRFVRVMRETKNELEIDVTEF